MKATTIGIDLAKNVIKVHGVDERATCFNELRKRGSPAIAQAIKT